MQTVASCRSVWEVDGHFVGVGGEGKWSRCAKQGLKFLAHAIVFPKRLLCARQGGRQMVISCEVGQGGRQCKWSFLLPLLVDDYNDMFLHDHEHTA